MADLNEFLITTGRTLSQMALYAPEHPSVKGAINEAHRLLTALLAESAEVVISVNEGKLIVNGKNPEGVPDSAARPFLQVLKAFDLHSLSFLPGISPQEMIPFFRLATSNEIKKLHADLNDYFAKNNVTAIRVNEARYAKIGEDESVAKGETKTGAEGPGTGGWEGVDSLSLNELIKKLIDKSVNDPSDRMRVFERALGLVKKEIDAAVEKVVVQFNREKTLITNIQSRTEGVVGTMAEGVVVVDEEGRVLMMNPAAEDIYGVKLGESLGKPLWEGVHEEQMVALAKDMTVPSDRPIVKEVNIHGSKETQKTLRASAATVQDINGHIVGMVSVLSDVTKQKELTRLQNEFMANVTHDLRAPIHAVKLAVAAILEGAAGATTGEQQKMLFVASRNIERLSRLIDDLLDFSKVESGAMEIHPQVIELTPLLREAATSMESWSKSREINLVFQENKETPPVFADGDRLLQVINNLISNAIKFTPAGGRITLRSKRVEVADKKMAVIEVEDTGKGISADDQKRIFDRFVQLQNKEKLDIRGTGLGLSICRALVELHKGQLTVQSPPLGQRSGSLFSFTIPAVERSAGPTISKPTKANGSPAAAPKKSFWRRIFSRSKIVVFALSVVGTLHARPYSGVVRRVLEPNLVQLKDGTRVRYLGIKTPEKYGPVYVEALAGNRNLVENKEIVIRYGFGERDADGIWLGYVFADNVLVNEQLVRDGLAFVSRLPNEKDYLKDLLAAEREARREKRGLWSDPSYQPPSEETLK